MKYLVTAEIKDAPCVNGGTDNSLMKSQLEMILNTVYSPSGLQVFTTLVTPNHGGNMYISETRPLSTYEDLVNAIEQGHIDDTGNIWTNYSPCPVCARTLLNHYSKASNKPTIHIAQIYTENDTYVDAVTSMQCLAKMEHVGFSIMPWNFNQFKRYINESCANRIDERNERMFKEEYMKLVAHVEFIHQVSQISHASSWCE